MYVRPISSRFWFGRLTPAILATLALPLLVAGVRADDHGAAVPLDHAAALTHGLHGRTNLQGAHFPVDSCGKTDGLPAYIGRSLGREVPIVAKAPSRLSGSSARIR